MLIALLTKRRLYIRGRRVHHGLTGLALCAVGLALMLDDLLDAPHWVADFRVIGRDRGRAK